jgi:hypothetical protein
VTKPTITGLTRVLHPEGTVLVTGDYVPVEELWLCGGYKGTLDIDAVTPDGDYLNWLQPTVLGDVALYWFDKAAGEFTDLTDKIREALPDRYTGSCYVNTLAYSIDHDLALIGIVNGRGAGKYALLFFDRTNETFEAADPAALEVEDLVYKLDNGYTFNAIRVGTPSLLIDGVEQLLMEGEPLPETWVLVGGYCDYADEDIDYGIAALCSRIDNVTHWLDITIAFGGCYTLTSVAIGEFKSPITDVGLVEGTTFLAAGHHGGLWLFAADHSINLTIEEIYPHDKEGWDKNWVVEYNPTRHKWIAGCWYPDTLEKPIVEAGWYSDTAPTQLSDIFGFIEQDDEFKVLGKHRMGHAVETELISIGDDLTPATARLGYHDQVSIKVEKLLDVDPLEWSIDSYPINDTFRFTEDEAILFLTHKIGADSILPEMITLNYTLIPTLEETMMVMIGALVSVMMLIMVMQMFKEMIKTTKEGVK